MDPCSGGRPPRLPGTTRVSRVEDDHRDRRRRPGFPVKRHDSITFPHFVPQTTSLTDVTAAAEFGGCDGLILSSTDGITLVYARLRFVRIGVPVLEFPHGRQAHQVIESFERGWRSLGLDRGTVGGELSK